MRFQLLILLAMAVAALASRGHPPVRPILPSKDPSLCIKRLETYPSRTRPWVNILGGQCLQARTYKSKYGPHKGGFFFETCCKDKNDNFAEPTFVNVDECVVFDPAKGQLGWNNLNSKKIRDHCSKCRLEQVDEPEQGQTAGPYLSCECVKEDKKTVKARLFLGSDGRSAKEPKDSFWANEKGRLVCKK
ncbi:uncharacterized protein LY79DRAFT_594414 [Colletotrichum navitas]|uniref:Cyanovirin-N domain-containing protein n=1 Tax=Colletotrichum navitas TaxID=681940 RepID=A0AAD8PM29_9PEZI|nr:uncharacterized protein LY79DRAFT_594414 [Colletotrichum navitas]KAK1570230.1 hypothetical protein LY79DRAFT_594414 [Colletotrichum navitas]